MVIAAANGLRACYLRPVAVRTGEQMGFYPIGVPVEVFITTGERMKTYQREAPRLALDAVEQLREQMRRAGDSSPYPRAGGH